MACIGSSQTPLSGKMAHASSSHTQVPSSQRFSFASKRQVRDKREKEVARENLWLHAMQISLSCYDRCQLTENAIRFLPVRRQDQILSLVQIGIGVVRLINCHRQPEVFPAQLSSAQLSSSPLLSSPLLSSSSPQRFTLHSPSLRKPLAPRAVFSFGTLTPLLAVGFSSSSFPSIFRRICRICCCCC